MITSNGQVPVAKDDDEPVGPGRVTGKQLRELVADDAWLDDLIDSAQQGGVQLTGAGGFLPEMIKAVLERGLAAELTGHLGYEQGDPAGRGSPNSRNGFTPKKVSTEIGPVPLDVPRDRASTFDPRLVPKGQRRLGGLDEQEMEQAADMLSRIRRERGITIIWVEHIMGVLMRVVDRCIVLDHGEVIAQGSPAEVVNHPKVMEVYLGTDAAQVQDQVQRQVPRRDLSA